MHRDAYDWVKARAVGMDTTGLSVLEIGSYNVNGSVRSLFPGVRYMGIDRRPGLGVDLVCDAREADFDEAYDLVLSTEALEHDPEPQQIVRCAWRALRPGGVLLLTAASPERAPHGCDGGFVGTEHYAGISPAAMRAMLQDWQDVVIEHHPERGDVYARAVRP